MHRVSAPKISPWRVLASILGWFMLMSLFGACQKNTAALPGQWVDGASLRAAGKLPALQPVLEISIGRNPLAFRQVRRMQGQVKELPDSGSYSLEVLSADGRVLSQQNLGFRAEVSESFDDRGPHLVGISTQDQMLLRISEPAGATSLRLTGPAGESRTFALAEAARTETSDRFLTLSVANSRQTAQRNALSLANDSAAADVVFVPQGFATQAEFQQVIQDARTFLESIPTLGPRSGQIRFHIFWTTTDFECQRAEAGPIIGCNFSRVAAALNEAQVPYDAIEVVSAGIVGGGAGYGYTASGRDPATIVHEMSHALFRLADEYSYGHDGQAPAGVEIFDQGNCAWVPHPHDPIAFPIARCTYDNAFRSSERSLMSTMQAFYSPAADRQVNRMLDLLAGPVSGVDAIGPLEIVRITNRNTYLAVQTNKRTTLSATLVDDQTGGRAASVQLNTLAFSHTLQFVGLPSVRSFSLNLTATTAAGEQIKLTKDIFSDRILPEPAIQISQVYVDQVTDSSARVNWATDRAIDAGVQYRIPPGTWSGILHPTAAVNPAHIVLNGLTANAQYQTRIVLTLADGSTQVSGTYAFQMAAPIPPEAPLNLAVVSKSSSSITLSWTHDGQHVTGFSLLRYLNGSYLDTGLSIPASARQATVSGLTPQTSYTFQVRAMNGNTLSPFSNMVSDTTQAPIAPDAPTNFRPGDLNASTFTVAWDHSGSNETGFVIEESLNGAWQILPITIGAGARQASVPTPASSPCSLRVKAINGGLYSAPSNVIYVNFGAASSSASSIKVTSNIPFTVPGNLSFAAHGASNSSGQWVGLAPAGSSATSYVAWNYVSGTDPSGALSLASTITPGQYVLRLFKDGGYTVLAESAAFAIQAQSAIGGGGSTSSGASSIKVTSTVPFALPGNLSFAAHGASNSSGQWVALAPAGSAATSYVAWNYVAGTDPSGSFSLPATLSPGQYVLRLFKDGGYTVLAESGAFAIQSQGSSGGGGGSSSSASATIKVTSAVPFTVGANLGYAATGASNHSGQWVGLAPQGAPATTYVAWTYVAGTSPSGSFFVSSPLSAGNYVLRLFQDGGFTILAESAAFYVH